MFDRIEKFVREVRELETDEELSEALNSITLDLGFRYYALTHHVDLQQSRTAIRIHNYPRSWEEWFDEQSLGRTDPVHRASSLTSIGFAWSRLPELISLTAKDRLVLDLARKQGIGDGFTIPAHVPGEAHGSCSFACAAGETFPERYMPLLQLAGAFAFEAARCMRRKDFARKPVQLTDRQRECVVWAARGKSDWEIGMILGISEETVGEHLRHARERYGVAKRALVAIHALFDGHIDFLDVLRH